MWWIQIIGLELHWGIGTGSESKAQSLLRLPPVLGKLLKYLREASSHIHSNWKPANKGTNVKTKPKPINSLLMKIERYQSEDEYYIKFWSRERWCKYRVAPVKSLKTRFAKGIGWLTAHTFRRWLKSLIYEAKAPSRLRRYLRGMQRFLRVNLCSKLF